MFINAPLGRQTATNIWHKAALAPADKPGAANNAPASIADIAAMLEEGSKSDTSLGPVASSNSPKFRLNEYLERRRYIGGSKARAFRALEEKFDRKDQQSSVLLVGKKALEISDVLLARAKTAYTREKAKTEDQSNIVIVTKSKRQSEFLARRLVTMFPQDKETRNRVFEDIKLGLPDHADLDKFAERKPKIIFLNADALKKHSSEAITATKKYIDQGNLAYAYFNSAAELVADDNTELEEFLQELTDQVRENGELVGTTHFIPNKENQKNFITSLFDETSIIDEDQGEIKAPLITAYVTNVGRQDASATRVKKTDLLSNKNYINNELAPLIIEEARNNPKKRILVKTNNIKALKTLRSNLYAAGEFGESVNFAWSYNGDGDGEQTKTYISGKEEKINSELDLIDRWGKDFNVLVYCNKFNDLEEPADVSYIFDFLDGKEAHNIESIIAPASYQSKDTNTERELIVFDDSRAEKARQKIIEVNEGYQETTKEARKVFDRSEAGDRDTDRNQTTIEMMMYQN